VCMFVFPKSKKDNKTVVGSETTGMFMSVRQNNQDRTVSKNYTGKKRMVDTFLRVISFE